MGELINLQNCSQSLVFLSPSEGLKSVILSLPAPHWKRSAPLPPVNSSLPLPPLRRSFPSPPFSLSLPAKPAYLIISTFTINAIVLGSTNQIIILTGSNFTSTAIRRWISRAKSSFTYIVQNIPGCFIIGRSISNCFTWGANMTYARKNKFLISASIICFGSSKVPSIPN